MYAQNKNFGIHLLFETVNLLFIRYRIYCLNSKYVYQGPGYSKVYYHPSYYLSLDISSFLRIIYLSSRVLDTWFRTPELTSGVTRGSLPVSK